jgi:hypothetical protein
MGALTGSIADSGNLHRSFGAKRAPQDDKDLS